MHVRNGRANLEMADTQLACADHHRCNSFQMFNREKPGGLQSRRLSRGLVLLFLENSSPQRAERGLCHNTEFASVQGLICDLLRLCSCISFAVEKLC